MTEYTLEFTTVRLLPTDAMLEDEAFMASYEWSRWGARIEGSHAGQRVAGAGTGHSPWEAGFNAIQGYLDFEATLR